jgi:hypothetical protein
MFMHKRGTVLELKQGLKLEIKIEHLMHTAQAPY